MSSAIFSYVMIAALRERLMPLVVIGVLITCALSYFFGAAAVIEKQQFVLVFAGFGLRLLSMFSLVLFTVFFIRRSFEAQEISFFLSSPVSRIHLVLSYGAALFLLAVIMSALFTGVIALLTPESLRAGAFLWGASLVAENIIVVSAALFFAMSLRSAPGAVLATLAFYLLARMNGHILGILESGGGDGSAFIALAGKAMAVILTLMPRLDLMGQGSWLIYGTSEQGAVGYELIALQGAIFCAVAISATIIDFVRKQF